VFSTKQIQSKDFLFFFFIFNKLETALRKFSWSRMSKQDKEDKVGVGKIQAELDH
jgi:hypothetical protein